MEHDFEEKLVEGEVAEAELDNYFSRWQKIKPVSRELQRLGIDRIWTNKISGTRTTVEYKADSRAADTGNAFIETVSVQSKTQSKPGWAKTSCAQVLVYYLPNVKRVYVFEMLSIREQLADWGKAYRTAKAVNKDYVGKGILVPLSEFEKHTMFVLSTG